MARENTIIVYKWVEKEHINVAEIIVLQKGAGVADAIVAGIVHRVVVSSNNNEEVAVAVVAAANKS